jgi:hypothetical protein
MQGCGHGSIWIRIIFESWIRIRIRLKSWIRIKVKIQKALVAQKRAMDDHNGDLEAQNGVLEGL